MSTQLVSGVVSEVFPNQCNVILDHDPSKKLLCSYRRSQFSKKDKADKDKDTAKDKTAWRERSPVSPGDKVEVQVLGSKDGVLENILPRKNCIQRKAPGKEGNILHTIAANIDHVVIVSAFLDPPFSFGFIDRFLVSTQKEEITPLIVINKMDLSHDPSATDKTPWKIYEELGFECFPISAHDPASLAALKAKVKGKTSVFCGHSGVGKTSLLHELFGEKIGKIGIVNRVTGKGKHTTTVSMLLQTEDGTRFIDTPGIKEFGLFKVTPMELIQYFPELYALQVKREKYDHLPRYESYIRIKESLEDNEN